MADLSEKLGLEDAAAVAQRAHGKVRWDGWTAAMPNVETDRRATVEAVAALLEAKRDEYRAKGRESAFFDRKADAYYESADFLRRELLSPSPGEGRPEAGDGE